MNQLIIRKAVVTGGAGFIGSNLVESLLRDGIEVTSIDDYSAGKKANLAHCHSLGNLNEVNHDTTKYNGLEKLFEGADVIFNQACSKNTVCMKNPARDLEVNAEGTLNCLHAALKQKVPKFVHASSGSVYGRVTEFPSSELTPLNPVSYYGVSKLAGERYTALFSTLYGMNTNILRYYHVFGPRQDFGDFGGVVAIFARNAIRDEPITIYGDGNQVRSFTYVEDVVRINRHMAENSIPSGEAYNCASGVKITIKELAEKVLQFFGRNPEDIIYKEWRPGDIKEFHVANEKLKKTGFDFKYSYNEGLERTLSCFQESISK